MTLAAVGIAPVMNLENRAGLWNFDYGSHQSVSLVPDCPLDPEVVHGELTDYQRWLVTGGGRKRIWNFVVEVRLINDQDDYRNLRLATKRTTRIVDDCVSAFRIAKSGDLWAPLVMIRMSRDGVLAGAGVVNEAYRWDACETEVDDTPDWNRTGDDLFSSPYVVGADDVNDIQTVLDAISRHLAKRPPLKAAVARFNRLFDRKFGPDATVEICAGFEALYRQRLPDKDKAQGIRGAIAHDLATEALQHHTALEAIPDWYSMRNELLHEGEISQRGREEFSDDSSRTKGEFLAPRELLRRALWLNLQSTNELSRTAREPTGAPE